MDTLYPLSDTTEGLSESSAAGGEQVWLAVGRRDEAAMRFVASFLRIAAQMECVAYPWMPLTVTPMRVIEI